MIRRFANDAGQLYALNKTRLGILKRPKSPKSILWRADYYKDPAGDLDGEWLRPIEQRFAKHYPKLADEPWQTTMASQEEGEAFIDWAISQLCRTQLVPSMIRSIMGRADTRHQAMFAASPRLFENLLRVQYFQHTKEVFTCPGWRWKCFQIRTDANLVLTDHPVCNSTETGAYGSVLFVPLSRKRVVFGGSKKALENPMLRCVLAINCFLAAWADQRIYAADTDTLYGVVKELKGHGAIHDAAWLAAARQPHFGLPARAAVTGVPDGVDTQNIFEEMKRRYEADEAQST